MKPVEMLGALMIILVMAVFLYNIYVLLRGIREMRQV